MTTFTALEYRYYTPASPDFQAPWSLGTTDAAGLLYDGSVLDLGTGYTAGTTIGMAAMLDLGPTPPTVGGAAFAGIFTSGAVRSITVTLDHSDTGLANSWSTLSAILNSNTINGTVNRTANLPNANFNTVARYWRVFVSVPAFTPQTIKTTDFRLYDMAQNLIAGPVAPTIPLHLTALSQDSAVVLTWDASTE